MTTLAVRAQEQAIERRAKQLAQPGGPGRRRARAGARRRSRSPSASATPLSAEQQTALRALTGPERLAVLVGPAGTGKGVVIDAAARAEQNAGRETHRRRCVRVHRRAARRGQPRPRRAHADARRAGRPREPRHRPASAPTRR